MRDHKVATRYAGALFAAAEAVGQSAGIAESYKLLYEAVKGNQQLRTFLESPQVSTEEKRDLMRSVLADKVEPLLVDFVILLIDKNRIEFFRDIGLEFILMVERSQGYRRAVATTAVPLPEDLGEQLSNKLAVATGAKIILQNKVDPKVIGGISVTMGDEIIDDTVRTNLARLRKSLLDAPVR